MIDWVLICNAVPLSFVVAFVAGVLFRDAADILRKAVRDYQRRTANRGSAHQHRA